MFRALWVAAMAATHLSVPEALQIAAAGLALSVLATWGIKLVQLEGPSMIGPRRSWTKNWHLTEGLCWSPWPTPWTQPIYPRSYA